MRASTQKYEQDGQWQIGIGKTVRLPGTTR